MGRMTLILGGARSGKSTYAQRFAAESGGRVAYIATARALDPEMEMRIAIHQQERPVAWETLELPTGVGRAVREHLSQAEVVVLDCVTMLVANLMLGVTTDENEPDEAAATAAVGAEMDDLLLAIRASQAVWMVVSNEVGLGLVPPYPLGRLYRDLMGRANQKLADQADEVYLLVAGIPVPIHQFRVK